MRNRISQQRQVVVTDRQDYHIPFVERHLDKPFIIIDAAAGVLAGLQSSYQLNTRGQFEFVQDGHAALKNISGVWYRRPSVPELKDIPTLKRLQHYSRSALENFERFIWTRFSEALWVSDPHAMVRANDKLAQLETAARLGFRIPKTLVTASPQAAKDFVRLNRKVVVKAVGVRYFTAADGVRRSILTHWVDEATDFKGLKLAPAFLQQAIEPELELRVTLVGDQIFAATVRSTAAESPSTVLRDWRIGVPVNKLDIQAFNLPASIAKRCRALLAELGLRFGAIDLMLDKRGTFWFIEINPEGQWAFVEEATGQPIGQAIATMLMRGQ